MYNSLWTLSWHLVSYSCPQMITSVYLFKYSLLQLSTVFSKLLGLHSCHHCSGFIRLWAPASSNFKPNFSAHLLFNSPEIWHIYIPHTMNSTAEIWAQSLNNWQRYYTYSSPSPPNFYLLSLTQFSRDFFQTRCDKFGLYTLSTVQNSRRSHQPISLNRTFFFCLLRTNLLLLAWILSDRLTIS